MKELVWERAKARRVQRDAHPRPDRVRVGGGARWAPDGRGDVGGTWDLPRARAVWLASGLSLERKSRKPGLGVFRSVWTEGTERRTVARGPRVMGSPAQGRGPKDVF